MIILFYILFVLTIISNIVSVLFYIKSANRKAHYTMLEIKALKQVRDQIERLSKWKTQSVNRKFLRIITQYLNTILVVVQLKKRDYKLLLIGLFIEYSWRQRMIGILEAICIFCMFLVGVLFPLGILIYMTVIYVKEEIEINRLSK